MLKKTIRRSPFAVDRSRHCRRRKREKHCDCVIARFSQKCQFCGKWITEGDCINRYRYGWGHTECYENENERGIPSIEKQYNLVHYTDDFLIEDESKKCYPRRLFFEDNDDKEARGKKISSEEKTNSKEEEEDHNSVYVSSSKAQSSDPMAVVVTPTKKPRKTNDDSNITREQKKILSYAPQEGEVVCVQALAGCGKTTTISLLCNQLRQQQPAKEILYMVFNKNNEEEAKSSKKFPKEMEIRTTHAFVLKHFFGIANMHRVKPCERYDLNHIIDHVDLYNECSKVDPKDGDSQRYQRRLNTIASYIRKTIEKFESSADNTINEMHVFWRATSKSNSSRSIWKKHFPPARYVRWASTFFETVRLQCDKLRNGLPLLEGDLSITHDAYLKAAQLDHLKIPHDVVLIDEAQDMTPCQASLLWGSEQRRDKIIYLFGDCHQQLYRFRGAADSFNKMVQHAGVKLSLTGSFRFGKNIAAYASSVLRTLGSVPVTGRAVNPGSIHQEEKDVNRNEKGLVVLCRNNQGIYEYLFHHKPRRWCKLDGQPPPSPKLKPWVFDIENFMAGVQPSFKYKSEEFQSVLDIQEYAIDEGDSMLMRYILLLQFLKSKKMSIKDFFQNIASTFQKLSPGESSSLENYNGVVLSTVHKAKGLEFPRVLLYNDFKYEMIATGTTPASIFIDEANILYVATTRAKERLYLTSEGMKCFKALSERAGVNISPSPTAVNPLEDVYKAQDSLMEQWEQFKSSQNDQSPIESMDDVPWPPGGEKNKLGLDSRMEETRHRVYLRKIRLMYHPDKFLPKFGARITSTELREQIKKRLERITQLCNALHQEEQGWDG